MQPSGSTALDDLTADTELDAPVTVLVPNNDALSRNTTRLLARQGNLQGVRFLMCFRFPALKHAAVHTNVTCKCVRHHAYGRHTFVFMHRSSRPT